MSAGSRKKRASRPWNNPAALRDLGPLPAPDSDDELSLAGYEVRRVDPGRAHKDYACPACGNVVPSGEGHVVVWPRGDSDLRRHWHRHCWRIEVRNSAPAE
ncbi:MAG: hypothetical protein M3N17_07185 [Actinomycetota bacterium]|nr:hypothetical protein [Actinomycetota bacterium]